MRTWHCNHNTCTTLYSSPYGTVCSVQLAIANITIKSQRFYSSVEVKDSQSLATDDVGCLLNDTIFVYVCYYHPKVTNITLEVTRNKSTTLIGLHLDS